jgi:hypothetical protein
MKALLAVAWRELRARWTWLVVIVVVGLLPFLGPLAGIVDVFQRAQVGLAFGCILTIVSTVVLGFSALGGELVSGRIAFFLARPIPWWSLFGGKWAASVLLACVALLAAVPALLAVWGPARLTGNVADPQGSVLLLSQVVLGLGLTQLMAIAVQSRSPWLAVDLALFATTVWLGLKLTAQTRLGLWLFVNASPWHPILGLATIALIVMTAGAVQYAVGRSSVRRCHAVGSLTLWTLMALLLIVLTAAWWPAR